MADIETQHRPAERVPSTPILGRERAPALPSIAAHLVPVLVTSIVVIIAGLLGWAAWQAYESAPWTRDGIVRAYVVTVAPEISGRIVNLPVKADQYVKRGDVLLEIDPTDYQIAVSDATAATALAKANYDDKDAEAQRRLKLTTLSASIEEQQNYVAQAEVARAAYHQDLARLAQAHVNLDRTRIFSPVNGFITNLMVQVGDYATTGQRALSIVNTDSFWVDGYFEETSIDKIQVGDPVRILLMSSRTVLMGHVAGIGRGIEVPNAQPDQYGLPMVNPVFTWIRLAQRIPIRVAIDRVPPGVTLAVGLTATVQIDRVKERDSNDSTGP